MRFLPWTSGGALLLGLGAATTTAPHDDEVAGKDAPLRRAVAAIQAQCFECHSEREIKGGLRLDQLSGWLKTIDKESPEDSELIYRMLLPMDDGDAMPPKGDRVPEELIRALQTWVEDGADEAAITEALKAASTRDVRRVQQRESLARTIGATIETTRAPGDERGPRPIRVSWSHRAEIPTESQLARVSPIAGSIAEISFAGLAIDDRSIAALPPLPVLRRAHLERTRITDAGVATLIERAPNLRYLNLHSTRVTAKVHELVATLPRLDRLVVFNTAAEKAAPTHPFASIATQQPRRLLVLDHARPRAVLLRETGLDTYAQLWESEPLPAGGCEVALWLGDTIDPAKTPATGPADGHGRVLIQRRANRLAVVNTRTRETVRVLEAPGPIHSFSRHASADITYVRYGDEGQQAVRFGAQGPPQPCPAAECPDAPLARGSESQRLSYGHRVSLPPASDAAPDPEAPAPQLFERNKDGEAVWTFVDIKRFPKGLRAAQVIERTK